MDLRHAVEAADLAEIIRGVDGLCAARDWDGLWSLRTLCRDAETRGKPLFAVLTHIDYRLALEAPAEYAARVLTPGAGRYGPGPLSEVAASTHTWSELEAHLHDPLVAAAVAQERVLRGEDLTHVDVPLTELPLRLLEWEPAYPGVTYLAHEVQAEEPPLPPLTETPEPPDPDAGTGARGSDTAPADAVDALSAVVAHWETDSTGAVRASGVAGGTRAALEALGIPGAGDQGRIRVGALRATEALAWCAWAGASGGAHGGRRGGAAGRFAAWWAATNVVGLDWPPDPAALGIALERETAWSRWAPVRGDEPGWVFRIAVRHGTGFTIAVDAVDAT